MRFMLVKFLDVTSRLGLFSLDGCIADHRSRRGWGVADWGDFIWVLSDRCTK